MASAPPSSGAAPKWVYYFAAGKAEGSAAMTGLLGGKGANLAEMASIGLPVPPGFTITSEVCGLYYEHGRRLPEGLAPQVEDALTRIADETGAEFGSETNPLLVAVRSGARASMPGMMDTILNLGLNDRTVAGLARQAGDDRFAYDSYRRFIQMYGDVVLGVDHGAFEDILDNYKNLNGFAFDTELGASDWLKVIDLYKEAIVSAVGTPFPQDTGQQLWGAIAAVFGSWQNARAVTYRRLHAIPDGWGTAVNVQAMVFGNMGDTSATGVAFTRNPSTGANEIYGEYLVNAQGEDVVAGIRTPQPLTARARREADDPNPSLEEEMPQSFAELRRIFAILESRYRDMQDIEFTIQNGKVWMLQTRSGKRTTEAAVKIAVDLAEEGTITRDEAVLRVDPSGFNQLLHPTIDTDAQKELLTTGLPASPGAAVGEIVFDSEEAERQKHQGHDVILVRTETSPEDIHGMHASAGILTARGGMTSHAAVVARGMGVPCVSGAGALRINEKARTLSIGQKVLKAGDVITIDGATGRVYVGAVPMRQPQLSGDFARLVAWADDARSLAVRANADTPKDARQARAFGAGGIGLCRTEHMFFDTERILAMREMICATTEAGRKAALAKILPVQRADFVELFEIMGELPVTIRLLDPPLHEFLPHQEREVEAVAAALAMPVDKLKSRIAELSEFNPMLGLRGSRLAIRYPEIPEMQARAIFEAAIEAEKRLGARVEPEIMIPLVAYRREYDILAGVIRATAEAVETESGTRLAYKLGTMIELPRACLMGGELAAGEDGAEFFSFGTNDLTQTVLGLSRDDAAPILSAYATQGVYEADPFVSIDQEGVGELVRLGIERGRAAKPDLKVGICGEHGGDPASIAFFHAAGFDYVSCSPFRVPIARLAAAQSAIRAKLGR
ncbi:MAG: pyruvate, phosphate dikinase [Hyphomicrobium sp.]|uniref:pyruvate, phosphate dikinase n=1 Tax=Hyphomicrobium sp. TaxID=82 RepID=UPI003D0D4456